MIHEDRTDAGAGSRFAFHLFLRSVKLGSVFDNGQAEVCPADLPVTLRHVHGGAAAGHNRGHTCQPRRNSPAYPNTIFRF